MQAMHPEAYLDTVGGVLRVRAPYSSGCGVLAEPLHTCRGRREVYVRLFLCREPPPRVVWSTREREFGWRGSSSLFVCATERKKSGVD